MFYKLNILSIPDIDPVVPPPTITASARPAAPPGHWPSGFPDGLPAWVFFVVNPLSPRHRLNFSTRARPLYCAASPRVATKWIASKQRLILSLPDTRSPKSGVSRTMVLLKALLENLSLPSGGLWQSLTFLWLWTHHSNLCLLCLLRLFLLS